MTFRSTADSDERPQLCIAWLLSREPAVVPLAGSSKRKWLDENAKAADLRPSEATLAALDKAFEPGVARGDRYPAPMNGAARIVGPAQRRRFDLAEAADVALRAPGLPGFDVGGFAFGLSGMIGSNRKFSRPDAEMDRLNVLEAGLNSYQSRC